MFNKPLYMPLKCNLYSAKWPLKYYIHITYLQSCKSQSLPRLPYNKLPLSSISKFMLLSAKIWNQKHTISWDLESWKFPLFIMNSSMYELHIYYRLHWIFILFSIFLWSLVVPVVLLAPITKTSAYNIF